jgi:glycine/D-amino acid oxidase-like deaminating enzyme
VARVFPELSHRPQEPAAFVPDDGVLFAAKGLAAMAAAARAAGAELSSPEQALAVEETPAGVRISTDRRVLEADLAVLAVGPWAQSLLEPLGIRLPLAPAIGQVSYWRGGGAWERRPSLIDFVADDKLGVYGLPTPGKGYKIGLDYGSEESWDTEAAAWPPRGFEEECNRDWVIAHAPGLASDGPHLSECCPWTMTPDNEYFIDRRGAITVATGCSGHAFKFMPIIGELIGDIAEGKPAWPEADIYGIDRMASDAPFGRVETPMGPRVGI